MSDDEHKQPPVLGYSPEAALSSSWPVGVFVLALIWASASMRWYTAATTAYRDESQAQFRTQLALLLCVVLRLAWARFRRERGNGWIFYLVLLLAAPVLWAVVAHPLGRLGRMLWGGPLMP